ncbi:MAG: TfoX/Sxy family protein [Methylococcales bacterium]|nr:TfoX/Sxy family protein [Methylococcales bacterium]
MTPSAEYKESVLERLEAIGSLKIGRFFGGIGISNGFVQFAMIMGNSLYFVVDDDTRQKYAQTGMQPFSYQTKKGRVQVRRYFELPEEVLTDPIQLQEWAREAMCIADSTQKPKRFVKSEKLFKL